MPQISKMPFFLFFFWNTRIDFDSTNNQSLFHNRLRLLIESKPTLILGLKFQQSYFSHHLMLLDETHHSLHFHSLLKNTKPIFTSSPPFSISYLESVGHITDSSPSSPSFHFIHNQSMKVKVTLIPTNKKHFEASMPFIVRTRSLYKQGTVAFNSWTIGYAKNYFFFVSFVNSLCFFIEHQSFLHCEGEPQMHFWTWSIHHCQTSFTVEERKA